MSGIRSLNVARNPAVYVIQMLVLMCIVTVIEFVGVFLYDNLPCDSLLSGKGFFIGYCETTSFGDFEHGAIAYGFVPEFASNVRHSDVLFLGESKMQTAVSTSAVHDYFAKKGLSFYAFGFGFAESGAFPVAMLDRINAHPMAVIINADGFFSDNMSFVADPIMGGTTASRARSYLRYLKKDLFLSVQQRVCALSISLCSYAPAPRSWFRSIDDGHWIWVNGDPDRITRPITAARDQAYNADNLARQLEVARRMMTQLKLSADCIILTGVPNPITPAEDTARAIATALDLPLAQPQMQGLAIRDDAHFNRVSADRWSAALMSEIDPLLDRCRAAKSP